MSLWEKKAIIINGKQKNKLFYGDKLVWSKMRTDFSKDFKNLKENEDFEGPYDQSKNAFRV
ncbi:hypothetical protein [Peptoniphilus lacrimalis]|uniref:Uncharacterized protein n=1 Tax=Peptoniphilus lacrimalis TaxID=33031 RepID=A0A379C631_9FIRM|nr:hypothetical protein [Peptoniphilus lacrimalis]SUB57694.1 Uncharacterised protein [Peptoniphilus lacrimalis]